MISKWVVVGRLREGQGQPGGGWCRRGVDRRVRAGPEGEPLQALESDVLGDVFPAAGACGGDTEEGRRREDARGAHRGRQDRPDGRSHVFGAGGGAVVPSRLLRLSAWTLGVGRGGAVPAAVLEVRLGDRSRSPGVLRLDRPRPVAQGGVQAHGPAVGPPLREAVVGGAAATGGRHHRRPGSGNPAGLRDLAVVGQPVPALRVRPVDGPEVPGLSVRALRG